MVTIKSFGESFVSACSFSRFGIGNNLSSSYVPDTLTLPLPFPTWRRVLLPVKALMALAAVSVHALSVALLPAHADSTSDFYIQQATDRYFTLPLDSRTLAMGGASALTCQGAGCVFLNPSVLGFSSRPQLAASAGVSTITGDEFLSSDEITLEEWNGFISGSFPLGDQAAGSSYPRADYGAISLAFSRYSGDTDDSLNTTPDGHRRSIGYGYAFDDRFAVGYAFHFLDDQLRTDLSDAHSHGRFFHDFAAQLRLSDGYTLGASFKLGIGQTDTEDFILKSNGVSHLRQYTGELALSKDWGTFTTAVGFGYTHQSSEADLLEFSDPVVIDGNEHGNDYNLRIGAEVGLSEALVLRGGFRYRSTDYDFERPKFKEISGRLSAAAYSLGLGYSFSAFEQPFILDYGVEYSTVGYESWEHLLGISVTL